MLGAGEKDNNRTKALWIPDTRVTRQWLDAAPQYALPRSRKLAQTPASWGAILRHHKQTTDVEMGAKCQTYWRYASLELCGGDHLQESKHARRRHNYLQTRPLYLETHVMPPFQTEHGWFWKQQEQLHAALLTRRGMNPAVMASIPIREEDRLKALYFKH